MEEVNSMGQCYPILFRSVWTGWQAAWVQEEERKFHKLYNGAVEGYPVWGSRSRDGLHNFRRKRRAEWRWRSGAARSWCRLEVCRRCQCILEKWWRRSKSCWGSIFATTFTWASLNVSTAHWAVERLSKAHGVKLSEATCWYFLEGFSARFNLDGTQRRFWVIWCCRRTWDFSANLI